MEDQPLINKSFEMPDISPREVAVSAEEKERFFKSILTDQPYEETVSLFDGQLRIRLKAMTVQENTDVVNQIVTDKKNGIAAENDAYFITISTYRLGVSLVSVDEKPYSAITKDNFSPNTDSDSYVLARAKTMLSWHTPKLAVFLDAFAKFEARLVKLTSEVQTQNFWKASA